MNMISNLDLPFKLGEVIVGKDNRKVLVADVIYSVYEKEWLVIYHSVTDDNKIGGTFTLTYNTFLAGL